MRRLDSKECWLISASYLVMLIPGLFFFLVAEHFFHQPHFFSLGIPIVGYILLVVSMTKGYVKYYGAPSDRVTVSLPTRSQDNRKTLWPLVIATISRAIPALFFGVLSLHWMTEGENVFSTFGLLLSTYFSVLYLVKVHRIALSWRSER